MTVNALIGSPLPFAGDIAPSEAWQRLQNIPPAQLVDVRTAPEWTFSGLPDLSALHKKALTISWKTYPNFTVNQNFIEALQSQVPDKTTPLFFMCKTGGRSTDAAIAATEAGYTACYNIEGGFEGDANADKQRGRINGWKAANLPWEQA